MTTTINILSISHSLSSNNTVQSLENTVNTDTTPKLHTSALFLLTLYST